MINSEVVTKDSALNRIKVAEMHFSLLKKTNCHIKGTMKQHLNTDFLKMSRDVLREN